MLNTHVHLPPNFSAFETAEDAVQAAAAEGVTVLGASNFHHHGIYRRFADAATAAGIVPLFGLEFISVMDDLRDAAVKVNDPANPGRIYLCGKGVDPFARPTATATRLLEQVRARGRGPDAPPWCRGSAPASPTPGSRSRSTAESISDRGRGAGRRAGVVGRAPGAPPGDGLPGGALPGRGSERPRRAPRPGVRRAVRRRGRRRGSRSRARSARGS